MKNNKIGFMVDGVLIDTSKFMLENGEKFLEGKVHYINEGASKFTEMFNCSKEVSDIFWKQYFHKYCLRTKPEKDAVDVLKQLKENGNEIYIITSRIHITDKSFTGELYRAMLKHWLNKNSIPFDGIIYCDKEKNYEDEFEACKKIKIDTIITDKISGAIALSEISDIILLNRPYNKGLHKTKIKRAENFKEVYPIIEDEDIKRRIR